jgi:hypothetical protein
METKARESVSLGDMVVAVYDEANGYSNNPAEVSMIVSRTMDHLLRNGPLDPARFDRVEGESADVGR